MKKDPRDRIPSSDLTAYERWELPLLDERGNEVWVRDDEVDLKPLTAEDLENIRQEALADGLKEGREQGYKEGFEQGRGEGYSAGREEGHLAGRQAGEEEARNEKTADIDAALDRLQMVMGELLDPLEQQTDTLETAMLNLTLALTRTVIHRELQLNSSQIRAVLAEAMAALPTTDEAIRIHVNPADSGWVRAVADRFEAGARVVEDDAILPGGCRVENRNSLVEQTVEKRYQKAVQQMLERRMAAGATAPAELEQQAAGLADFQRELLESGDTDEGFTAQPAPRSTGEASDESPD